MFYTNGGNADSAKLDPLEVDEECCQHCESELDTNGDCPEGCDQDGEFDDNDEDYDDLEDVDEELLHGTDDDEEHF